MADCATGNQATITFATTGFVAKTEIIEGLEETREPLECTGLEDASAQYVPDAIIDRTPLRVVIFWDTDQAGPPVDAAPEQITITFPLQGGQAAAAKLEGQGFLSRAETPTLQNGEVMRGEYDVMFSTRPTYTAAT